MLLARGTAESGAKGRGGLTFEQAVPIIEGKLYGWAEFRQRPDYPGAAISRAYEERIGKNETRNVSSPQETWVVRYQAEVYEAGIIEAALKRMSEEQRKLIYLRYVERNQWIYIADQIHVEVRGVYRIRDQALAILGADLGLYHAANGGVA